MLLSKTAYLHIFALEAFILGLFCVESFLCVCSKVPSTCTDDTTSNDILEFAEEQVGQILPPYNNKISSIPKCGQGVHAYSMLTLQKLKRW